ncbi:Acriflavin resistance plasma membrane protein [Granulibacter bethesdensis]|uniref:Acriflavin resistance plasma membrane protein n=1 Tax=Granulibacter bethesdensis TaxID=364410 RepID=A0AAC9KAE8_9PROT|nr:efflux RND transporter permease subunit [Granulibacter bethesdensis]APH54614.1 Acriflavin resistance plasma membrane protein [Granulibacter bethesdensis]APH62200.1 Acriflavin resistance plasma membrane protein [Granulibacter bethesdensis]
MNISAPFIARPIATSLLAIAVMLGGLLGYLWLPVSSLPEVDFPTIQVMTRLPGLSPTGSALLLTAPLERQFGQIPGLTSMISTSADGISQITLQFDLSRNMDSAAQDVQAAINAANGTLPANLPYPPTYSKINPADAPILSLALTSGTVPLDAIADITDTVLQPKLSQLPGVGRATIQGSLRKAVRIRLLPDRLAAYGLSLEDVRNAVSNANVNGAKGGFDGAERSIQLGANDQLVSPDAYRSLVIAWRNNAPVRLSNIASIVNGLENDHVGAWVLRSGTQQSAVVLDIQRQPGANIVATVGAIREALPELQNALPAGVQLSIIADRTDTIRASVTEVEITLLLSIFLVVAVIYLFLGSLRATIIPGIALPLSLIGTFAVMYEAGYSLDNLSLMALTIATGFVVDDAIVMIENVVRYIERGVPPLQAAYEGARQIGFTIISLTVSLVAVFIPLLFMSGVVGRLFKEFAITLTVAVVVSAVISLTLTPMMCGRLLRPLHEERPGLLPRLFERGFAACLELYRRTLRIALAHQSAVLLVAFSSLAITIILYVITPKGFLPAQDTGIITIVTEADQSVSIKRMGTLQNDAARLLAMDPAVETITSLVGVGTTNATPNTGRLTVVLKPPALRDPVLEVIDRFRTIFAHQPGLTAYMQAQQDIQIGTRITRTQYQYTIIDTDVRELQQWAPRLLHTLKALPMLQDVASDQQDQGSAIMITVDRAAAMRLGITVQAIEDTLYDAFGQRQISTIYAQSNQYRVVLESDPAWQALPDVLSRLRVPGQNDTQVPLAAVATLAPVSAPLAITHQEQFPSITFSFNLAPGISLEQAMSGISDASLQIGVPETIAGSYSGDAAEFQRSLASEPWLILAAIIVIYIVLGVLYESTIHPVTILSTLPSAGIGALLALMATGTDLSLVALIGIVLLMGIVKKNAIMMIDFAIEAERDRGLSPAAAIEEACLLRFRPIIMTTAAALLGALPLALQHGAGSELRYPLGVTIIGGLLLSQLLTLYTTPVIYLMMERLRIRLNHGRKPGPLDLPAD